MGARTYTFDSQTQLSDETGAITASAAGQVGGSAKVIDWGLNTRVDAQAIIDISAIDIASGDELYTFLIQGSSVSNFASNVQNLAAVNFGKTAVRPGGAIDSLVGRYEIGFTNEQAGVMYQYCRLFRVLAGTSPSITSTVWTSTLPGE
jgi:hypothetical protein